MMYFILSKIYYEFWRRATRYFPFSLFYQDRLFHYKNHKINRFMIRLQNKIKKFGINTMILKGQNCGLMIEFYGTFNNKKDKTVHNFEKMEKLLQESFETIYIRENNEGFTILVPAEMLINMKVIEKS